MHANQITIRRQAMANILVSFYKDGSTEPAHQVMVDSTFGRDVVVTVKKHFQDKNMPSEELDFRSVISYNQATINGVDVIK